MGSTTYQLLSRISSISSIADNCLMTSNSNSQRAFSPTFPHSPSIPSSSNRCFTHQSTHDPLMIHSSTPQKSTAKARSSSTVKLPSNGSASTQLQGVTNSAWSAAWIFTLEKWWWICYGFGRFAYNQLEALMRITKFQQILRFDEMKHDEPYLYL